MNILNSNHLATWKLWNYTRYPGDHPLFRRTQKATRSASITAYRAALILGIILVGWFFVYLPAQWRGPLGSILFPASVMMFSSGYVIVWILNIVDTILGMKSHGAYDVVCVPPSGALGANWAIGTACLHRYDMLHWISIFRNLLILIAMVFLLPTLLTVALQTDTFDPNAFLGLIFDMIALGMAVYFDHIQATLLGLLLGLLAPTYYHTRSSASTWAIIIFITVQITTVAIPLLTMQFILPELFRVLQLEGWFTQLSPSLVTFAVFYLSREIVITTAWKALRYQLYATQSELFGIT